MKVQTSNIPMHKNGIPLNVHKEFFYDVMYNGNWCCNGFVSVKILDKVGLGYSFQRQEGHISYSHHRCMPVSTPINGDKVFGNFDKREHKY